MLDHNAGWHIFLSERVQVSRYELFFLMIIFYLQKHAYNCLAYHMFSAYRLLIYCYFIYLHAITFVLQEVSNNLIKTKIGNVAHIFTSIKSDLTDLLSK